MKKTTGWGIATTAAILLAITGGAAAWYVSLIELGALTVGLLGILGGEES